MSNKHIRRSNEEWMSLITQCRQSGLADKDWCDRNSIPVSSFYNAVVRLRKQACDIPDAVRTAAPVMDLTNRQDVVRIDIVPDVLPAAAPITEVPAMQAPAEYIDKSHMIEIVISDTVIRIGNGADPLLLETAIRALRGTVC